jgi:membrane protease YdiL (CAAX protease family)
MQKDLFLHPFTKLLTLIFIMVTSFFVLFSAGYLVAMPLFGLSWSEISEILTAGQVTRYSGLFRYFQIVQTLGLFVVPPFIAGKYLSDRPRKYLGFRGGPSSWSVVTVIILVFVALPFINFLAEFNQEIQLPEKLKSLEDWLMSREGSAREMTGRFLEAQNLTALAVNILMVGVLPAVGEELVFRGLLQRIFAEWTRNAHLGILIAAFLFSAMHVQFYGLIPRMFLGVLFGYLFLWSGSIWLPILGHFVNNTSAVVYYYFVGTDTAYTSSAYDMMGRQLPLVIFSLGMIGLCCYLVYLNERKRAL